VRDAKPIDLTNGGNYTSKLDFCQNKQPRCSDGFQMYLAGAA
jgi:hypothetical protein